MSSIKKTTLIVNYSILFAFTLYLVSGLLPVAGAIASQEPIMGDNGTADVPTLSEVLAWHPVSLEGLIDKGNKLYSLKEYSISIGCYNDALKIDPNSSVAWYGKGCSLAKLGESREAISSYDKALATLPVPSENLYTKGNKVLRYKNMSRLLIVTTKALMQILIFPQCGSKKLLLLSNSTLARKL